MSAYINLTASNAAAVTFVRSYQPRKISDPIIIPADSIVTVADHDIVFRLGEERLIVWRGAWALNGRPCPEPAWKELDA